MIFGKKIKKEVKKICLKDISKETCGLIGFKDGANFALECQNDAENPIDYFLISPKNYLKISLSYNIIGCFHSHINDEEEFSEFDKKIANNHNIKLLLFCVKSNKFKEYEPNSYKSPYIGREFIWGKQDCLSLIIDFYNKELNKNIKNLFPNRTGRVFFEQAKKGWDFEENKELYKKYNFNLIKDNNLKKYDLLIMKDGNENFPCHAGIYLGSNQILHQPRNNYSLIEDLTNNKQNILFIARPC